MDTLASLDAASYADEDTSIAYDDDSMLYSSSRNGVKLAGIAGDGGGGDGAGGGGLGSLADELAGAMYDSDEEYDDEDGADGETVNGESSHLERNGTGEGPDGGGGAAGGGGGRRRRASDYDGSEYGDHHQEGTVGGMSLALESKINEIEQLAMRNKMMMKEEESEVIPRLMEGLQFLPPQSSLETSGSRYVFPYPPCLHDLQSVLTLPPTNPRLVTAHAALASHMLQQAISIRDLSLSLSFSSLPAPDTSDLLPPIVDLIPRPTSQALAELASLHSITLSLVSQLSFLSDSLHMARQSSIAANRKLRVAKEACADWKAELEKVDRSKRWIEEGDWVGRCRRREAAGVCAEVICGFEDVCKGFEERLKAQALVA